jgi:hypothetical protein
MGAPESSPDTPLREGDQHGVAPDDPLGVVPAQGKHAARPSEAERHQAVHEYPQTDEEALRQQGVEPDESLYRDPPGGPGADRRTG